MNIKQIYNYMKAGVIITAIVITLCLPGIPAAAAGTAIVSVYGPAQPVSPGAQFTVTITVQPNAAIAGAQVTFSFNPSLVSVNSVSEGNLLNQNGASTYFTSGQINNGAGIVTGVAGAIITPGQTVSNLGTLAVITMTAGSTRGNSALSLSNVVVGNINGQSVTVNTTDGQTTVDRGPVLSIIGSKTVSVGSPLTFTISATDPDGDSLTYSASNLPSGASFNASSRIFLWTPSLGQVGTYANVHFEVSDAITTAFENINFVVNKVTPVYNNLSAPNISVGATPTSLGGNLKSGSLIPSGNVSITLNGVTQTAAINASGTFNSNFVTSSLVTNSSPYVISYVYSGDTNFNNVSDTTKTLTVNKIAATVTLSNLNQTYDGTAKSATVTTSPAGLGYTITYNGSSTSPTSAGSYNILASISSLNYSGSATGTLAITKVTPVYTNLNAPNINVGTSPTGLGGNVKSGSMVPTGSISITLNGVTQLAAIDDMGNFNSNFVTSSLGTSGSPYIINYSYAGNTNFNAASDNTKTITVIQPYAAWDINIDYSVNIYDMISISQHMAETGAAGWIRQDINGDGVIDVLELIIIGQHWTG